MTSSDTDPLSSLEDAIGPAAFARLAQCFGGSDICLPITDAGRSYKKLVAVLGAGATRNLMLWGGGCRIYVPRTPSGEQRRRYEDICELRARGKTLTEIASEYTYTARYTERQIRAILATAEILPVVAG